MRRALSCIFILGLLAACAQMPQRQEAPVSACTNNEASYDCQVERYHNVNM